MITHYVKLTPIISSASIEGSRENPLVRVPLLINGENVGSSATFTGAEAKQLLTKIEEHGTIDLNLVFGD